MKATRFRSLTAVTLLISCLFISDTRDTGPAMLPALGDEVHPEIPRPESDLYFELNRGQADAAVRFLSRGSGYAVFFGRNETLISVCRNEQTEESAQPVATVSMQLLGGNPEPEIRGGELRNGKTNYLIGDDPKEWVTQIPQYASVEYRQVYPGIDLVYYGNAGRMEYDFIVSPYGNPADIAMRFDSEEGVRIDEQGNLVLLEEGSALALKKPVAYQDLDEGRTYIDAEFALAKDHVVGFDLGDYDPNHPLIIDPVMVFSTFFGNNSEASGYAIAVDTLENIYITGTIGLLPPFPTTSKKLSPNSSGPDNIFITKMNPEGTELIYSTVIGGSNYDFPKGLAVDRDGNIFIAGRTHSNNFPTVNAIQTQFKGDRWEVDEENGDGFVLKLDPAGDRFIFSTYFGGEYADEVRGIAVDRAGNAVVTGYTESEDFPVMNALQSKKRTSMSFSMGHDVFIAKFNKSGNLVFSTYLGGDLDDEGNGIAVDRQDFIYVTGKAGRNFPNAQLVYNAETGGPFVLKMEPDGSALLYSEIVHSVGFGQSIAVDAKGQAYIAGTAAFWNEGIPTVRAFQNNPAGYTDAFICKLGALGKQLIFSSYLGGSSYEHTFNIAVDAKENIYVCGITQSTDFPLRNPLYSSLKGNNDAFVAKIDGESFDLVFSTYLGGSGWEFTGEKPGIAVSPAGYVYVTGRTMSSDFPTTPNAFQKTKTRQFDAYIVKFQMEEKGILDVNPNPVVFPYTLPGKESKKTVEIMNTGGGSLEIRNLYTEPDALFALENLPELPFTLKSKAKATVQVVYAPPVSGTGAREITFESGELVIHCDAELTIVSIPLMTTGLIVNDAGDASDADPTDGVCDTDLGKPGHQVTLRAAIEHVNAMKDDRPTRISFAIPGDAAPVIKPKKALPEVMYPIDLDGSTQKSGYVVLNGTDAGENTSGLLLSGGNSTVASMRIVSFGHSGLVIQGKSNNRIENCEITENGQNNDSSMPAVIIKDSNSNIVADNVISLNPGGGLVIQGKSNNRIENCIIIENGQNNDSSMPAVIIEDSDRNIVANNVISLNPGGGLSLSGVGSFKNIIRSNKIGTDVSGTYARPNFFGIALSMGANNNEILANTISGNHDAGISFINETKWNPPATQNVIRNNNIGVTSDGKKALGNKKEGILIIEKAGNENLIEHNVISGNKEEGILIIGAESNRIERNWIGTDSTGTIKLPNEKNGIKISGGKSRPSKLNIICENIVAANLENGIFMEGQIWEGKNYVVSNWIGINKPGNRDNKIGNSKHGIYVEEDMPEIYYNTISDNEVGILIVKSFGVLIHGNLMEENKTGIEIRKSNLITLFRNFFSSNNTALNINNKELEYTNIEYQVYQIAVMSNSIHLNRGKSTGIHISDARVSIRGNSLRDDAGDAITVEGDSEVLVRYNNIADNGGFGLNNLVPAVPVSAGSNWWGHSSGPGGSGSGSGDAVSGGVDFAGWLEKEVSVFAGIARDTVIAPVGRKDSIAIAFSNWAERDDELNVTLSDDRGWLLTPSSVKVRVADHQGDLDYLHYSMPGQTAENTANRVRIVAVSKKNTANSISASFYLIARKPVITYLNVYPDQIEVMPGDTVQFTVSGYDQFAYGFPIAPVWTCSGGTITSDGLFIAGNQGGSYEVTVTDRESGLSTSALVELPAVTSLQDDFSASMAPAMLLKAYPNPFSQSVTLHYHLSVPAEVVLQIYSVSGQRLETLADGFRPAGDHVLYWQADEMPDGLYFYRFQMMEASAEGGRFHSETGKLLLAR